MIYIVNKKKKLPFEIDSFKKATTISPSNVGLDIAWNEMWLKDDLPNLSNTAGEIKDKQTFGGK